MTETVVRIPRAVMAALTGNVDIVLFAWSFVVVAWVVLVVAEILRRAWRR